MISRLATAALLCLMTGAAFAAPQPGVWTDAQLERQQAMLWPGMDAAEINEAIDEMPDRIGSMTLNRLQKALLLAPFSLPDAAPAKGEDDKAADATHDDLTAQRIGKLLDMGALVEARRLVEIVDRDDLLPPVLMDQAVIAFLASGRREAACLDLLAYKSESPEQFAALKDASRAMAEACTAQRGANATAIETMPTYSRALKGKITYTLADLARMDDAEAVWLSHEHNATLVSDLEGAAEFNAFRDLSPFKQALVINSPFASSRLQWHMLPYAIRHDLAPAAIVSRVLRGAPITGKNIDAKTAIAAAKGKPAWQRLPYYYKAITSHTKDSAPPVKELLADILASGASYDLYSLQPFAPYFRDIDISSLSKRNAWALALSLGIAGENPAADSGRLPADESPWVLSILSRDQGYNEADFKAWTEANLEKLSPIDADLNTKLSVLLKGILGDNPLLDESLTQYDNKKGLTPFPNYVMHEEQNLSRAQEFARDKAVGPMIVSLALAGKNINPDRMDPAGMESVMRLLSDTGLTQSAKTLAMETLVFRMGESSLANGE